MLRPRAAATVVTALVAAVAVCPAAVAVQNDHFGLTASGNRTKLIYPPGGAAVHDSVLVYNRTGDPVTVKLDVIAATPQVHPQPSSTPYTTYSLGASGQGFASHVHLATTEVHLAPHAQQTVGVTIDRPPQTSTGEYAAVTGVEVTNGGGAGLGIQERLAVLVGIQPGTSAAATAGGISAGSWRVLATVVAGLLVVALAVALWWRRRREERTA